MSQLTLPDLDFPVAVAQRDCFWNTGLSFFPVEMTVLGMAGASLVWCTGWYAWLKRGYAQTQKLSHPCVHTAFISVHNSQTRSVSFNRVTIILFVAPVDLDIRNTLLTRHWHWIRKCLRNESLRSLFRLGSHKIPLSRGTTDFLPTPFLTDYLCFSSSLSFLPSGKSLN